MCIKETLSHSYTKLPLKYTAPEGGSEWVLNERGLRPPPVPFDTLPQSSRTIYMLPMYTLLQIFKARQTLHAGAVSAVDKPLRKWSLLKTKYFVLIVLLPLFRITHQWLERNAMEHRALLVSDCARQTISCYYTIIRIIIPPSEITPPRESLWAPYSLASHRHSKHIMFELLLFCILYEIWFYFCKWSLSVLPFCSQPFSL